MLVVEGGQRATTSLVIREHTMRTLSTFTRVCLPKRVATQNCGYRYQLSGYITYKGRGQLGSRFVSVRSYAAQVGGGNGRLDGAVHSDPSHLRGEYDAIVMGAGHNGLVSAAYLAQAGLKVCVLERRHLIGGAAVTEEIVPGYKFSRASYVLSLLRPQIYKDLELKRHGLRIHLRNPNSYTPLLEDPPPGGRPRSLLLGRDEEENYRQISQFSEKDAKAMHHYETQLNKMAEAISPLLDNAPVSLRGEQGLITQVRKQWAAFSALLKTGRHLGKDIPAFYELITAPTTKVLDKWFESEPLKATLATDSVIGAMVSPDSPGSGYVLLHHVMGELEGIKGAWGYAEGGMGAVSDAIGRSAMEKGAQIFTEKPVESVLVDADGKATGVVSKDGTEIKAKVVLSNATPRITYQDLIPKDKLPEEFLKEVSQIDFTSPVTKINVAVNKLPNFTANPNQGDTPMPHHRCTIHMNCENSQMIKDSYMDALRGQPSEKPVIEMTIPSSLDPTLAPPGHHVVLLFTQYTPYHLAGGREWDDAARDQYADRVFDQIEAYAPGFKESVVGREVLTPPDLEKIFGLTGGNIFHGSMSLDQLYLARPVPSYCDTRSPITSLYLCGSGAHPGGGVMGSPGMLAARAVLKDLKK